MNDIESRAKALYDACQTSKPDWDQLGDVTKSVWREMVEPYKWAESVAVELATGTAPSLDEAVAALPGAPLGTTIDIRLTDAEAARLNAYYGAEPAAPAGQPEAAKVTPIYVEENRVDARAIVTARDDGDLSPDEAVEWIDKLVLHNIALATPQPAEPAAELDWPLPCDVQVGNMILRKGVKLEALVKKAQRLVEALYGPPPTPEEAAHNLAVLQGSAEPEAAPQSWPNLLTAAREVLSWTEIHHRPPVRDEFETGRMVGVRLHALADLHAAVAASQATERPTAECVGDTRFEGWLSEHECDTNQNTSHTYSKQDMRDCYWAGYTERRAPVEQPANRAQRDEFPPLPEPVMDMVKRGSISTGGGSYGHEISREGVYTADQMHEYARAALQRKGA